MQHLVTSLRCGSCDSAVCLLVSAFFVLACCFAFVIFLDFEREEGGKESEMRDWLSSRCSWPTFLSFLFHQSLSLCCSVFALFAPSLSFISLVFAFFLSPVPPSDCSLLLEVLRLLRMEKEGLLTKQGRGFPDSWRERWFVLKMELCRTTQIRIEVAYSIWFAFSVFLILLLLISCWPFLSIEAEFGVTGATITLQAFNKNRPFGISIETLNHTHTLNICAHSEKEQHVAACFAPDAQQSVNLLISSLFTWQKWFDALKSVASPAARRSLTPAETPEVWKLILLGDGLLLSSHRYIWISVFGAFVRLFVGC